MRKATQDRIVILLHGHHSKIPQDRWDRLSASERVEELTGQSLDNCRAILDLPMEMAVQSPCVMNGKVQVVRAILGAVTRIGMESSRLVRMQDELLEGLINDFGVVDSKD